MQQPEPSETEVFICPECGAKNPPIAAETGTEYTRFEYKSDGYKLVSREVQKTKPPYWECGNCSLELGTVPDSIDFSED